MYRLSIANPTRKARPQRRPTAFSFIEILFAIMILAIGFIMVAAMFPVAIKQTDETVKEEVASIVAKAAVSYIARIAPRPPPTTENPKVTGLDTSNLPLTPNSAYVNSNVTNYTPTGQWPVIAMPSSSIASTNFGCVLGEDWVWPMTSGSPPINTPLSTSAAATNYYSNTFPGTHFYSLCGANMILSTDPRYAWVPFYLRNDPKSPYAQVIIIVCQSRNTSSFTAADLAPQTFQNPEQVSPIAPVANLQGRHMTASFYKCVDSSPDYVQFDIDGSYASPAGTPRPVFPNGFLPPYTTQSAENLSYGSALSEGAYVIIADDTPVPYRNVNAPSPLIGMPPRNVSCNGFIYRLGQTAGALPPPTLWAKAADGVTLLSAQGQATQQIWTLMPGNDMKHAPIFPGMTYPASSTLTGSASGQNFCRVYVVGRGITSYTTPTGTATTFAGPAMDLAAFSAFVKIDSQISQ